MSWIIVDYDTNTISHDELDGLKAPNSHQAVITVNHRGTVFVDIQNDYSDRRLTFDINVEKGAMSLLDQRLWLEVERALKLPIDQLNLAANTWLPGLLADRPDQVVCFPYAQHFLSDNIGYSSRLRSAAELKSTVRSLDFRRIAVCSVRPIKIMFVVRAIASFLINLGLLMLVLFT